MEYNFSEIEQQARQKWQANAIYKVENNSSKPKYYVLDMFPYPSGAGYMSVIRSAIFFQISMHDISA